MPDTRHKSFTQTLLKDRGHDDGDEKSFTAERQSTAQAFNLHVERRDGRHNEGFAWAHYETYQWTDEGSHERLVVIFTRRAVEIEGHNLGLLVAKIREGHLTGIRELASARALQLGIDNPDNEPVITAVRSYPEFEDILKGIKGEQEEHDTGFAGKVRGR